MSPLVRDLISRTMTAEAAEAAKARRQEGQQDSKAMGSEGDGMGAIGLETIRWRQRG